MRQMSKRAAAITATAAVAVGGFGAAAYAAGWFKSTGTATAQTASIQDVTATVAFPEKLYPGKTVTATAVVGNPNEYKVRITGIKPGTLTSVPAGCTFAKSDISVTLPQTALEVASATEANVPVSVKMGQNADEVCAGATLTYTFQLEGAVAAS
jgi:hypothetical protein